MIVRSLDGRIYGEVPLDEEDARKIANRAHCPHLNFSVHLDTFPHRITCDLCEKELTQDEAQKALERPLRLH